MDSDTTSRKGDSERILRRFDRGEIDILVGTQMITKGHDFPGITLVGVIAADASLNIPDFRAAERTFQILTQVSGRGAAGRSAGPGRHPDLQPRPLRHPSGAGARLCRVLCGRASPAPATRLSPFFPPRGAPFLQSEEGRGKKAVAEIGARARELAATVAGGKMDVIGPAESPLARIRGRYRWQLLLRGKESRPLLLLAQRLLKGAGRDGLEILVDVDPVNFM